MTLGYDFYMFTGINQSELMVLESHVVYSLSKEKTAARLFIVQCTQPNYEDLDIPVKDVIERLVIFTPYFHLFVMHTISTCWWSG